jgi:hypothetical protein
MRHRAMPRLCHAQPCLIPAVARRSHALPRHANAGPELAKPDRAPDQAPPGLARPCPALPMPRLARPGQRPARPCPYRTLPSPANPCLARPGQALTRPNPPRLAAPCQTLPRRRPSWPRRAWATAIPSQSEPEPALASPALPHPGRLVPVFNNQMHRAAGTALAPFQGHLPKLVVVFNKPAVLQGV